MKKTKVSFIIIYTNDNQLFECKKWIQKQTYTGEIEYIILDNKENKNFSSASSALNEGAKRATGDILFFMHQDVYLWDLSAVKNIVEFLDEKESTIVGAAGVALKDFQIHFDIFMKDNPNRLAWGTDGVCLEAYTLDELLLVMNRATYEKHKFDEITCDNWHCYGMDICLANYISGGKNYIFPLEICHDSYGLPESDAFIISVTKLAKKYEGKIERLSSTCIDCQCSEKGVKKYYKKRKRRTKLKAFLKKVGLLGLFNKISNHRQAKKGRFIIDENKKNL